MSLCVNVRAFLKLKDFCRTLSHLPFKTACLSRYVRILYLFIKIVLRINIGNHFPACHLVSKKKTFDKCSKIRIKFYLKSEKTSVFSTLNLYSHNISHAIFLRSLVVQFNISIWVSPARIGIGRLLFQPPFWPTTFLNCLRHIN